MALGCHRASLVLGRRGAPAGPSSLRSPGQAAAESRLGRCGVPAVPSWAPAGPLWGPGWAAAGFRLGRLPSRYNQSHVSGASFVTLIALR